MTFNHIVKQNVLRDKSTYISFFLSSVFSITIFFFFLATAFHPTLKDLSSDSALGLTMLLASFMIYLFSFVFITYSLQAFLKKKTKLLGVLSIVGASKKQLNKFTFRENMLVGVLAIFTAILTGLAILPLFFMLMKNILKAENFSMYFPIKAILITFIVFLLLFVIVSIMMNYLIKKGTTLKLLKSDKKIEKPLTFKFFRTIILLTLTAILLFFAIKKPFLFNQYGLILYPLLFIGFLLSIYFVVTQSLHLFITLKRKSINKHNILFVSNLVGKERSHSKIIFALSLLVIGVFISTSVLFSSYNDVAKQTEALYPYTLQYTSLPNNSDDELQQNLSQIRAFFKEDNTTKKIVLEYKTDTDNRIGFISNTQYNQLSNVSPISLSDDNLFVVTGNSNISPDKESFSNYEFLANKEIVGEKKENILSTGIQDTFYVVSDSTYETIQLATYHTYLFESDHWKTIGPELDNMLNTMTRDYDKYLIASKAGLYTSERFVKSVMFFIGFMLSLIFLVAAMSILYFYLQSNLSDERKKYQGIRKIGLSKTELKQVISKELRLLIFLPFTLASLLMLSILISLRTELSSVFIQTTLINFSLFLALFIISYFSIRRVYFNKLV